MSVIKEVLRQEAKAEIEKRIMPTSGYVLGYNETTNRMDIAIIDPRSGENVILKGVIYAIPLYGFHGLHPRQGHRVMVNFDGGDISMPKVTAMFDDDYRRHGGPYEALYTEFSAISSHTDNIPQAVANAGYVSIPLSGEFEPI